MLYVVMTRALGVTVQGLAEGMAIGRKLYVVLGADGQRAEMKINP